MEHLGIIALLVAGVALGAFGSAVWLRSRLTDTFKALSADALRESNESFLNLANERLGTLQEKAHGDLQLREQKIAELVRPLQESLSKVDQKIHTLEQNRLSAYASLEQHLQSMATTQAHLHSETNNLVKALRAPTVRGRWGEIQLKRVVEMAGMLEYCDFLQQETTTNDTGGRLRPDMIVKLPNKKNVVVDSKAPLSAYLEALEATDEKTRVERLVHHARQIRTHMNQLGQKGYWDQFKPTPEFVVLFLPGETFFSAALEQDPSLIEFGVEQKVILATPTTLIALLRAVAYGWRQEQLAENAQKISEEGKKLFERMNVLASYINSIGKGLNGALDSYNKAVRSIESRIMPAARRFSELGIGHGQEIDVLNIIESTPSSLLEGDGTPYSSN